MNNKGLQKPLNIKKIIIIMENYPKQKRKKGVNKEEISRGRLPHWYVICSGYGKPSSSPSQGNLIQGKAQLALKTGKTCLETKRKTA